MTSKQRFMRACQGATVDRPPVWIMRQAGRTLPEYLAVREQHDFWKIVTTPELAALVTLQPVHRFALDAAIIFSDILVIPDAMGLDVQFAPFPVLSPLRSTADIAALKVSGAAESLAYVAKALQIVARETAGKRALLGFAGAPFTLASYMVEGGTSKTHGKVKTLMYSEPQSYDRLLSALADVTADYLEMQIEAGADAVQLFDSWAGELAPADFREFALPYVRRIIERIAAKGAPVIYYINGIGNLLEAAHESGADVLGVDWRIELAQVRQRLGAGTVVQGNLDPAVLFAPPDFIRRKTHEMVRQTNGVGHIANLGHGVHPDTPLDGIRAFIDAITEGTKTANEQN